MVGTRIEVGIALCWHRTSRFVTECIVSVVTNKQIVNARIVLLVVFELVIVLDRVLRQTFLNQSEQQAAMEASEGTVSSAAAAAVDEKKVAGSTECEEVKEAPKKRGRTKKSEKPRIDIDDEIDAANTLCTLMKKLAHQAKMQQRNSERQKTRLLKKCGKLSAQDMERLAIMKRCGLLANDGSDTPIAGSSSASASGAVALCASSPEKKKEKAVGILQKLAGFVSKTDSEDSLECLQSIAKALEKHCDVASEAGSPKKKPKKSTPKPTTGDEAACAAAVPIASPIAGDVEKEDSEEEENEVGSESD